MKIFALALTVVLASMSAEAQQAQNTKAAATVAGKVIPLSQLEQAASPALQGISDPAQRNLVLARVLNDMVTEAALLARIETEGLAAQPGFKAELDRAARRASIELYMQSRLSAIKPPTEAELDRFIRQNPDLFSKRRVFHYIELVIPSDKQFNQSDLERLAKKGGSAELEKALEGKSVVFSRSSFWRGAEQLNEPTRALIYGLSDGETRVQPLEGAPGFRVIQRMASYPDPMRPELLRNNLRQGLLTEQRQLASLRIIADAKSKAGVTINAPELLAPIADLEKSAATALSGPTEMSILSAFRIGWLGFVITILPLVLWKFIRFKSRRSKAARTRPLNPTIEFIWNEMIIPSWRYLISLTVVLITLKTSIDMLFALPATISITVASLSVLGGLALGGLGWVVLARLLKVGEWLNAGQFRGLLLIGTAHAVVVWTARI